MNDDGEGADEVIGPARPPLPPSSSVSPTTTVGTTDDSSEQEKPKIRFGPSLDLLQQDGEQPTNPVVDEDEEVQRRRYDVEVGPRPLPSGIQLPNGKLIVRRFLGCVLMKSHCLIDDDSDDEANDIFTGPVLKKIYPHMVTTSTDQDEKKDGREEWMLTVPKGQNPYGKMEIVF